jgi:opacity protein-like surface antigen
MLKQKLLLTSFVALFASASYATTPNPCCFCPHFYAGVEGGYSMSAEANVRQLYDFEQGGNVNLLVPENTTFNRDIESSSVYGLFLGYQFNPNLALQLTYDHRNQFNWSVPVDSSTLFPEDPMELYVLHGIRIQTFFVDLKLAPSVCWNGFVPYVKAGIGASRNRVDYLQDIDIPRKENPVTFDTRIDGDTLTKFAWNAGAGVDYYFNRQLAINVAYRFVDSNRLQTGTHEVDLVNPGPQADTNRFQSGHLFFHEVLANVTYHFG